MSYSEIRPNLWKCQWRSVLTWIFWKVLLETKSMLRHLLIFSNFKWYYHGLMIFAYICICRDTINNYLSQIICMSLWGSHVSPQNPLWISFGFWSLKSRYIVLNPCLEIVKPFVYRTNTYEVSFFSIFYPFLILLVKGTIFV